MKTTTTKEKKKKKWQRYIAPRTKAKIKDLKEERNITKHKVCKERKRVKAAVKNTMS